MTLQITRWSPDTCGCILEYEWDDTQPADTRGHTFSKAVQLCEHHKALLGKDGYDTVLSENTRKNITWNTVKKQFSLADADLERYIWFFDKDRNLQVSLTDISMTTAQKNKLQSDCDKQFGSGKVKVV